MGGLARPVLLPPSGCPTTLGFSFSGMLAPRLCIAMLYPAFAFPSCCFIVLCFACLWVALGFPLYICILC